MCFTACPKISKDPPSEKDPSGTPALDASKGVQTILTLPLDMTSFDSVYFIDPGLMCRAQEGKELSHAIVRRVSGGEVLQTLEGVQKSTALSFRKSFTLPNRLGQIETLWVDFLIPVSLFKLLYAMAPKDKLEELYAAVLFLAIPIPNRVLSYFFAKNHLMAIDPEFYWTNRTYMYLYLLDEYPNLLTLLQQSFPSKDDIAAYLSSLHLSVVDTEILDRFVTFSTRVPTVLTLSLLFDCQKMWMVHGRPPPCVFLQKHMIERTSRSTVSKAEAPGYVCPVQRFHLDDQRVVWNYLCPLGSPSPTCSDVLWHSFDPNDEYIKFQIKFYADDDSVTGLFCPTEAEESVWCGGRISLPQAPQIETDEPQRPLFTPPPQMLPEESSLRAPDNAPSAPRKPPSTRTTSRLPTEPANQPTSSTTVPTDTLKSQIPRIGVEDGGTTSGPTDQQKKLLQQFIGSGGGSVNAL